MCAFLARVMQLTDRFAEMWLTFLTTRYSGALRSATSRAGADEEI